MAFHMIKKVGRVASRVTKKAIEDPDYVENVKHTLKTVKDAVPKRKKTLEELQAGFDEYYANECDGECETCEYYDVCPDEPEELEGQQREDAEGVASGDDPWTDAEAEDDEPLSEEEYARFEAAEAYYAEGCDGECETCEHYDYCPAEEIEEPVDPDSKVLFKGVTQGDVKKGVKNSVDLARETSAAAKELKEAMDDIVNGLGIKEILR